MKPKKDQVSGIFWLIIAVMVLISSAKASLGSFSSPGPGLISFIAASLLGFFSILNIVVTVCKKSYFESDKVPNIARMNWKNIARAVGALFAFPVLLSFLGFNLTVFGVILFLVKAIEPRRWVTAIFFALIVTIVCYVLFVWWLKFFIEKGIFGI
jgi:hypothetical protein